ncbi:hypothetical protein MMC16_002188 [Acarospora aff. strigata]|nr:hypothetical protein [Acarospora aff. strigata]
MRVSARTNVNPNGIRIEQERNLLESLVVTNRLSFANLRKLERVPAADGRKEQDEVHPSLGLAMLPSSDRESRCGKRNSRSSVGSTAWRISEHRSLLEENHNGVVDCLLARWTAGNCDAAEDPASQERSQSLNALLSPKVSYAPRPPVRTTPLRTGEWIPGELDCDECEDEIMETVIETLPASQLYQHPEELYRAQAKQMVSSRNWIIENYGTRLHLLLQGTLSFDAEAFQTLTDLFQLILVDIYWDKGFAESTTEPSLGVGSGSSLDPETDSGCASSQSSTSARILDNTTPALWHSAPSKPSGFKLQTSDSMTKLRTRSKLLRPLIALLGLHDKTTVSNTAKGTGTTDSDITVSDSMSERSDNSLRACPHPAITPVDQLARPSLKASPQHGTPEDDPLSHDMQRHTLLGAVEEETF